MSNVIPKSISGELALINPACAALLLNQVALEGIELANWQQITPVTPSAATSYAGKAVFLNVNCDLETIISKTFVIICATPAEEWSFGKCFPNMPGVGPGLKKASVTFLLSSLNQEKPLWVYIGLKDMSSRDDAIKQLTAMKKWTEHPATKKITPGPSLKTTGSLLMFGDLSASFLDNLGDLKEMIKIPNFAAVARVDFPDQSPATTKPPGATTKPEKAIKKPLLIAQLLPGIPFLKLEIPLADNITLDPAKLKGSVFLECYSPLFKIPNGATQIGLKGELDLKELGNKKTFAVEVDLPIDGDIITAKGSFQEKTLPLGIDLGGLSAAGAKPATSEFDLELDLFFSKSQKPALQGLGFQLDMDDWPIIFNKRTLLTIEDFRLAFFIADPLGGKFITARIDATAKLGKSFTFSCGGSHPDGQLYLRLSSNGHKFRDFLTDLDVQVDKNDKIFDIIINDLSVGYNYRLKYFSAAIDITANWTIHWFTLKTIRFGVYSGGEAFGITFGTQILLGGKGADAIPLSLAVSYDSEGKGADAQKSWQFLARTTNISIGKVLTALKKEFHTDISLPSQLNELMVDNLTLSFSKSGSSSGVQTNLFFTCEIKYPKDGGKADLKLNINLSTGTITKSASTTQPVTGQAATKPEWAQNKFSFSMEAVLVLDGDKTIELDLNSDSDSQTGINANVLIAKNPKNIAFNLQTFISDLSDNQDIVPLIPPIEIIIEEALLAYLKETKPTLLTKYLFGLSLGLKLDMSTLPLVGKLFSPDQGIKDIRILYATQNLTLLEVKEINKAKDLTTKLPEATGQGPNSMPPSPMNPVADTSTILAKGLSVLASANMGGAAPKPMALPLGKRPAPGAVTKVNSPYPRKGQAPPQTTPKNSSLPSASSTTWVDIGASIGPFTLKRIGGAYKKGGLELLMTSTFKLGILNFSLDGLGIKMNPFPPKSKDPGAILNSISPELLGMEADLQKGPLTISGGFLKDGDNYYGEVSIAAGPLSFMAIGGYSDVDPASFFIYVKLDAPLGGPPFFIVTGLAGGFGINRALTLPTIDTVAQFPLLPKNPNTPAMPDTPQDTLATVIPQLAKWIGPKPGEYWIAAGIQFTSFEMVDAFVLVSISFGVDFQLGLLGQGTMIFPKFDPVPLAFVQLDIVASVTPRTGLLAVEARLAPNCYVFNPLVKISGGFAFMAWFNGPNKGDFVISLGGYHPAFKKPANYPNVPRLQIKYGIGPFAITGKLYFALTPSMMMAGLEVSATWSSGPASLWFDAGVDFLLGWAPFHYLGEAYIRIGARVDLWLFSVNVHVGADITIWGPDFGGRADVDLGPISVTISFGADRNPPPPVGWNKFKTKFLPKGKNKAMLEVLKGNVGKGLQDQQKGGYDWIVDPNHFQIQANTVIPAGEATLNGNPISANKSDYHKKGSTPYLQLNRSDVEGIYKDDQVWCSGSELNIGPMDKSAIQSSFAITLKRKTDNDGKGQFSDPVNDFLIQPILGASPKALYGPYRDSTGKDPNSAGKQLISHTLLGILISPIPRFPDKLNKILLEELLFQQDHLSSFQYSSSAVDTKTKISSSLSNDHKTLKINAINNQDYKLSALSDPVISKVRDSLLAALKTSGFDELKEVTKAQDGQELSVMGTQKAMTDWPMIKALGA